MKLNRDDVYILIADAFRVEIEDLKNIKEDDSLIDHGMTSITGIQLIVFLEEKYGINVMDEDLLLENFDTLAKLFALLDKYSGHQE